MRRALNRPRRAAASLEAKIAASLRCRPELPDLRPRGRCDQPLVLPVLVLPNDRPLRLPPLLRARSRHRRVPQESEAHDANHYIDHHAYGNEPESRFLTRPEWLLQLIATPRAVDDRSVDFEEPLPTWSFGRWTRRCGTRGRCQLGLSPKAADAAACAAQAEARRRGGARQRVLAPRRAVWQSSPRCVRRRPLPTMTDSANCEAVSRSNQDDEWFELEHDEILAVAIGCAPPAFMTARCGRARRAAVRQPLLRPRGVRQQAPQLPRAVAQGLGLAHGMAGGGHLWENFVLTPADKRFLDRLLHVANGWPASASTTRRRAPPRSRS